MVSNHWLRTNFSVLDVNIRIFTKKKRIMMIDLLLFRARHLVLLSKGIVASSYLGNFL